jgi:hypothetical protein
LGRWEAKSEKRNYILSREKMNKNCAEKLMYRFKDQRFEKGPGPVAQKKSAGGIHCAAMLH